MRLKNQIAIVTGAGGAGGCAEGATDDGAIVVID